MIEYLQEAYESRLELGQNSWQAVLYRTLLEDEWFCNGGVLSEAIQKNQNLQFL